MAASEMKMAAFMFSLLLVWLLAPLLAGMQSTEQAIPNQVD
jgi:hypothetical protein